MFLSPGDYRFYRDLLGRHGRLCGARTLGYCLMTNHVHLAIAPEKEQSLARTLGRTHSEYALALNRAGGQKGGQKGTDAFS